MIKEKIPTKQIVGCDVHSRLLEFSIWNDDVIDNFSMEDSKPTKIITGKIKDLEKILLKHTIQDAEIVMEASTNVFKLSRIIRNLGRKPIVVKSDTIKNFSPQYKITDKSDAANLARAWIVKIAQTVYIPTEHEQELRDIIRGYRNAVQDCVMTSNRIWGFCSSHKLPLPKNFSLTKAQELLVEAKSQLSDLQYLLLTELVDSYANKKKSVARYANTILNVLTGEPRMQKLLQVLGVGPIIAFAAVAFIGDITRFKDSKKLCAYVGLVPSINKSGEYESKNHRIARCGVPLLKSLLVQGAQVCLTRGDLPLHRWARHLAARKQNRNIAIVALARKMLVYIWHILMGHQIIYKEEPQGLRKKISDIGNMIGKEKRSLMGFNTLKEFTDNIINNMELTIRSRTVP